MGEQHENRADAAPGPANRLTPAVPGDAGAVADGPATGGDTWIDPAEQGVPWVNPAIQEHVRWRNGDVVVSVPVKSGTTWTMNIVHQLRSGGDPDLEDIYLEVPWLEFLGGPAVSPDDVVRMIDSMPDGQRRAFKTHAAPETLPFQPPGSGLDVRYIVVMRHPDEVLASFFPFVCSHADEWFALWGIDKQEFVPSDMAACFESLGKSMLPGSLFGFLAAWWPRRHESNVLLLHFSDMKRDHEGAVRRIAGFLDIEPSAAQWPAILEYTSFTWMKQHEHKFELRRAGQVPVLEPGAMVRKGRTGAAREDGVTPAMSAQLAAIGRDMLGNEEALAWLYGTG